MQGISLGGQDAPRGRSRQAGEFDADLRRSVRRAGVGNPCQAVVPARGPPRPSQRGAPARRSGQARRLEEAPGRRAALIRPRYREGLTPLRAPPYPPRPMPLDPQARLLLDQMQATGLQPLHTMSVPLARQMMDSLNDLAHPGEPVQVEDREVPGP